MGVRVSPGREAGPLDRWRARRLQELRQDEIGRVRAQADKCRNGLTGLVGIVTTVSVVKGRSTLDGLDPWVRITVGGLLLLALVFATLGIFFGMRAGYGLPRREAWEPTARELLQRERREALDAVTDLRRSIALSFATVAALVAAIAFAWYGPAEAPNSRTDVAMNDRHPTEHLGR